MNNKEDIIERLRILYQEMSDMEEEIFWMEREADKLEEELEKIEKGENSD